MIDTEVLSHSLWKTNVKPALKKLRNAVFGEPSKKLIKLIKWYNIHSWIYETIRLDLRTYKKKPRPMSIKRLWKMFFPNLKNPIFIIGAPRSGTTFLGDCLAVLPELSYHFEPVITKAAIRNVATNQWSANKAKWFYKLVYGWLMRLHFDADLRFVDKTPRNSFIIPFLYRAFPNARFIYILRDGRDTSTSLAAKPWYQSGVSMSGLYQPGGYPFGSMRRFWVEDERIQEYETTDTHHRCIWLWRRYVESALEALSKVPEEQVHIIKYESLAENPQRETEALIDFLEITNIESQNLLRKAILRVKPSSIGRWRNELSEIQIQKMHLESANLLKQLGYFDEHSTVTTQLDT